jgi:hypothetical protein
MASAPESSAPLPSFLERFLEERSIKWMLGLGMLVLLGSSLKFVTYHWESYSPFWKYLVLIAYTAITYGLAEVGLHRLLLKRTGTGLLALTLGLLPLTFLALRWVAPGLPGDFAGLVHDVGLGSLLIVNLAFTACASRRILRTLLRRLPTTYWLAYLVLCVSGALAPVIPSTLTPVAAALLWSVFTAGAVKVNRHVFWLAEEECWPRIFSFFPTVLLSSQFLTVFALNFAPEIATPWLGFGLVLVAMPVLLTADAAARVFQQRSGQIILPWPTEVIAPLVIGLVACAAGLGLAFSDLPRPMALAPTAVLSAVCLGAVAHRTGHRTFAWVMLLCLLMAYQFTPVYFQQFAKQVVQSSAEIVRERRLPYAFYGITYAPFILGLALAGRWLRSELFAIPCRQLSIGLATVMLVASWTDPKAVFIAGSVLTVLWIVLRFAYADSRWTWGAGVSWLSAAWGLQVFLRDICSWTLPADFSLWALIVAAGGLGVMDRITHFRRESAHPGALEFLSTVTLGLLAAGWMWQFGLVIATVGTGAIAAILGLLALHQRRRAYPVLGELLLLVAGWAALRYGMAAGVDSITLALTSVIVLATAWAVAQAVKPLTNSLTVRAFGQPLLRVTTGCLAAAQPGTILALIVTGNADLTLSLWLAASVVTLWSLLAAGRTLPVPWVHVGCVGVLAAVGRGLFCVCEATTAAEWLPVAWGLTILLGGTIARRIAKSPSDEETGDVARSADRFAFATELLLALGTLVLLTWPARLAALLVLAGLAGRARREASPWLKHLLVELTFLQVLIGLLSGVTAGAYLWNIPPETWVAVQITGTFLAAVWLMILQTPRFRAFVPDNAFLNLETTFWELAAGVSTLTLLLTHTSPITLVETFTLAGVFIVLTADRFRFALRTRNVDAVWMGLAISAAGVGYLVWFQALSIHHVTTLGAGLATGVMLSGLARRCRRSATWDIFAEPFDRVGYWLPAVTAVVCVGSSLAAPPAAWLGINSLIVLAAAARYFVRWIETRDSVSLLAATLIFNASQMLLWRELAWSDPQLYLMPLGLSLIGLAEGLPRELRDEFKTTLRYAGAMVILVSPLFHILDGGWLPLLTLMAAALGVSVLSLGLKSRPLLYSGTAFLIADLIALVVRGSLERTDVLWIVGIGLGSSVIALAAYCENHRELVLQRMRLLAATLQTWD